MKATIFAMVIVCMVSAASIPFEPMPASEGIFLFSIGSWKCTVINDGIKPVKLNDFFDSASFQRLQPVLITCFM